MRFLRVLGAARILAGSGGQIVGSVALLDMVAHGEDRLARHLHAIGPHIGDEPDRLAAEIDALIELLRETHRHLRAEAELAGGFLLQGRGGEGRGRVAFDSLALDRADGEPARLHRRLGAERRRLVGQVELVELTAIEMGEAGGERRARRRREQRFDRPVFAGAEGLDLRFPLADQPERNRLHPPGAAAARQLAPEHGGEGEADEVIERPPCEIGFDQLLIEIPRVGNGGADRAPGDLVEGDPANIDALERPPILQHRADVPGDRLAFPVGVGRQIEGAGALQSFGDRGHLPDAALVGLPIHGEILLRTDGSVLGRQVADMAEAREHGEAPAEILVYCLSLGGRFDNDDVLHSSLWGRSCCSGGE